MFYSHELLSLRHRGKLARCWLAATVSDQIFKQMCKSSTVKEINLCDLCKEIINIIQIKSNEINRRFSLYLSSQLMYGAVKILSYQTTSLQSKYIHKLYIESPSIHGDDDSTLKNQVFQMNKKTSYYKMNEIYEVQNISADLELCNVVSVVKDYNAAQLDNSLPVLPEKFNINTIMEVLMHDATCLDFGALTHEQLNFPNPNDNNVSLEMLNRSHVMNINLDEKLNDAFNDNEGSLIDLEKSELSMHTYKISPIHDDISHQISPMHNNTSGEQVHEISFVKSFLPEVTMQEIESERSGLLTPQKRQHWEEKHTARPSKKTRLRFEDAPDSDKIVTALIPETEVASAYATAHPSEMLQGIEAIHKDLLQIVNKSRKKKIFADKNKQLSHKTIKTWLNNVNAHTVPLNIINVNMITSDIHFKRPSTCFTSIHKKKLNKSLSALFDVHTVTVSGKNITQTEYGHLLEKSTEFTRFEDRSNKTEELISILSSALGKSAELSKNISSEKSIAIAMEEFPEVPKVHDIIESTDNLPEIIQSPEITRDTVIPDTCYNSSMSLPSCLITKRELLVLFEIVWQNTDLAKFNDVISPDHYSKLDASSCFTFLLELYTEKKIIIKQTAPYDIIWIQKYA